MNELTNLIIKRTGITQEHAQKAVLVVFDFLKTKLPAPIASQLEPFFTGGTTNTSGFTQPTGGFVKKMEGVVAGRS